MVPGYTNIPDRPHDADRHRDDVLNETKKKVTTYATPCSCHIEHSLTGISFLSICHVQIAFPVFHFVSS